MKRRCTTATHSAHLDAKLVDFFLPGGRIRNIEGPMWDYKVGFCHAKAEVAEESLLLCELLHDIAALYNAYGGFLIVAFKDEHAERFRKFVNKDDFDKLTDRYLKAYIPLNSLLMKGIVDGETVNILLLHVSKRTSGPPVAYKRNSAANSKGQFVFKGR